MPAIAQGFAPACRAPKVKFIANRKSGVVRQGSSGSEASHSVGTQGAHSRRTADGSSLLLAVRVFAPRATTCAIRLPRCRGL